MATLVIKSNASQGTIVLIKDVGIEIPASGGSETFDTQDDVAILYKIVASNNLRTFITDDAYGTNDSTLILNDGTSDIAQADAEFFLDNLLVLSADSTFGVVKLDANDEITSDLTFDGTATVSDLKLGTALDANSFKVTNLATPTVSGDATNKSYVDTLFTSVTSGVDWKPSVKVATTAILDANTDISGSPTYNATGGTSTRGQITATLVVSGTFNVDGVAIANNDRILIKNEGDVGGLGGAANGIWYATISGTSLTLDRATDFDADAEVTAGSATFVDQGTVNADTGWILTTNDPIVIGGGSGTALSFTQFMVNTFAAGNGLTYSGGTVHVTPAAGSGLIANADDLDVDWGEAGDIQPLGNAVAAGALAEFARADHVHTHGDRGSDSAGSQHDADQIDVEGTYSDIAGTPTTLENTISAINANFGSGQYVGKVLSFGQVTNVPGGGTLYLMGAGTVLTSAAPIRILRSGTITAAMITVDAADATRSYKLSIQTSATIGGTYTEVASLALAATNQSAATTALAVAVTAGHFMRIAVIRTAGAGGSTFSNINAMVEYIDT